MADPKPDSTRASDAKPTTGRTWADVGMASIAWVFPNAGPRLRRFVQALVIIAIPIAIAAGAWLFLKPSKPDTPTFDNHGTNNGIIGPNATQNILVGPPHAVSDEALQALIVALQKEAPVNYELYGQGDTLENQLHYAFTKGGWPEHGLWGKNANVMYPGILVRRKAVAPGVDRFVDWLSHVPGIRYQEERTLAPDASSDVTIWMGAET